MSKESVSKGLALALEGLDQGLDVLQPRAERALVADTLLERSVHRCPIRLFGGVGVLVAQHVAVMELLRADLVAGDAAVAVDHTNRRLCRWSAWVFRRIAMMA